jgi:hypothetical protein
VCLSGLHPNTSRATIKALVQDANLNGGGEARDKVTFVEWVHGSTTVSASLSSRIH